MTQTDPGEYLEKHLYNDLRWLLCAATEGLVQQPLNPKDDIPGQHIKVYAMDSATLHARALFEFFTDEGSNKGRLKSIFEIEPITSKRYPGDWRRPINTHMMHAQDRTVGRQLTSFDGEIKKHLNRMPIDFAQEVVELWKAFSEKLEQVNKPLAKSAQAALDKAIIKSALVVTHGVSPIEW